MNVITSGLPYTRCLLIDIHGKKWSGKLNEQLQQLSNEFAFSAWCRLIVQNWGYRTKQTHAEFKWWEAERCVCALAETLSSFVKVVTKLSEAKIANLTVQPSRLQISDEACSFDLLRQDEHLQNNSTACGHIRHFNKGWMTGVTHSNNSHWVTHPPKKPFLHTPSASQDVLLWSTINLIRPKCVLVGTQRNSGLSAAHRNELKQGSVQARHRKWDWPNKCPC